MSYSCSENQPGTDMAPVGFQPSPSRYNFLPAKAILKAVETAQQLLSYSGANDSQFSKAAFFPGPPRDTAHELSRNRPTHQII